jgi:hypothetical protein
MSAAPVTDERLADLLAPVVSQFVSQARSAIDAAAREVSNVLRVEYNPSEERRPAALPTPRLQLRWQDDTTGRATWLCSYEMVMPLRELDCRNDEGADFAVIELGRTLVGGGGAAPWQRGAADQCMPFRDGSHARWDAEAFGGLPIYVLGPEGTTLLLDGVQREGVPA